MTFKNRIKSLRKWEIINMETGILSNFNGTVEAIRINNQIIIIILEKCQRFHQFLHRSYNKYAR